MFVFLLCRYRVIYAICCLLWYKLPCLDIQTSYAKTIEYRHLHRAVSNHIVGPIAKKNACGAYTVTLKSKYVFHN